jgi:hypothetical protein
MRKGSCEAKETDNTNIEAGPMAATGVHADGALVRFEVAVIASHLRALTAC